MRLVPFFRYFGSKRSLAKFYPAPKHNLIIEPFAGSAGYSLHWYKHEILLVEKYKAIADLWNWLITVSEDEFLSLPTGNITTTHLKIPREAKTLIGFWLQFGGKTPVKSAPPMAYDYPESFWTEAKKRQLARQLKHIRHWRCINDGYPCTNRMGPATWFVDPPYQIVSASYRHGSDGINYRWLGEWCRTRPGQTIVCEANGASWLPFRSFRTGFNIRGKQGVTYTDELIWTRNSEAASTEAGQK